MTWEVGDVAACLKRGNWHYIGTQIVGDGPTYGDICRVRAVGFDKIGRTLLWLDGWDGDGTSHSFNADRFRKIKPDAHEDCEPEFVELLKRSKVPACGPEYRQRMMLEALFGRFPSGRAASLRPQPPAASSCKHRIPNAERGR